MNELKPEDVMRAKERCVDCLHYEACRDWANGWGIETNFPYEAERNLCEQFQPKNLLREKDSEIKGLVDGWSKDQDRFEQVCAEKDEDYKTLEELYKEKCDQVIEANNLMVEMKYEIEDLKKSYEIQREATNRLLKPLQLDIDGIRSEAITDFEMSLREYIILKGGFGFEYTSQRDDALEKISEIANKLKG